MKPIDRQEYVKLCAARWDGRYLADAKRNFADFEEIHDQLHAALVEFHRDPFQQDINDRSLNPDGTLTAYLWKLQTSITPDQSCLYPLLDFCEHYQRVHLRRGLIAYCQLLLRDIETIQVATDGSQPELLGLSVKD